MFILQWSYNRGSVHPKQREKHHQAPSPETILSTWASNCQSFEQYLWAFVLYHDLFWASVGKLCPKVIASLLYTILAYERLHRNALLLNNGGNPYLLLVSMFRSYLWQWLLNKDKWNLNFFWVYCGIIYI